METDGKIFYKTASRQLNDSLGKDLFSWLSDQEDKHKQRFEQIFKSIKDKKGWPELAIKPVDKKRVETLFSKALKNIKKGQKVPAVENDIIDKAIEMEHKTYDFYINSSKTATYDVDKNFYQVLAQEENGHYLYLVDYKEYVNSPADFFNKKEKHSLDAGG